VDYAGAVEIAAGVNPLYDIPLQNIWLGSASRLQLENFRKLLERARKSAEKDRAAALRAAKRRQIDQAEAAKRAKRYDNAMINYYLGMKAYRDAYAARS
jgi:hypothetical protein